MYISVNKARTAISSLSAPCMVGAPGALQGNGGFALPKSKRPKISAKGAFSYKGNVTFTSAAGRKVVPVKITGGLSAGKLKGSVTLDEQKTGCTPYRFSARYYGVNPQG